MVNVSNNQGFDSASDSTLVSGLAGKFKIAMDTVMQGGRDIAVHLPPIKNACTGSCRFNSSYKKYMSRTGGICRTCKGEGYLLEQRQTTYRANIRHTEMMIEDSVAGKISQRVLITKTVIASYTHIQKSIGATIDGENYKLIGDLEKRGFGGSVFYVQATWKKIDK